MLLPDGVRCVLATPFSLGVEQLAAWKAAGQSLVRPVAAPGLRHEPDMPEQAEDAYQQIHDTARTQTIQDRMQHYNISRQCIFLHSINPTDHRLGRCQGIVRLWLEEDGNALLCCRYGRFPVMLLGPNAEIQRKYSLKGAQS